MSLGAPVMSESSLAPLAYLDVLLVVVAAPIMILIGVPALGYGIGAGAQFAKYLRAGDRYGLRLFATWFWQLGVRRVGAGLLKWRSTRPMYLGYCQLVYPWIGVLRSLSARVDAERMVYVES